MDNVDNSSTAVQCPYMWAGSREMELISGDEQRNVQRSFVEKSRIRSRETLRLFPFSIFGGSCKAYPIYRDVIFVNLSTFFEQVSGFSTVESSYPQISTSYPQFAPQTSSQDASAFPQI